MPTFRGIFSDTLVPPMEFPTMFNHTSQTPNTSAFSKLKSPTSCSLKGIKLYSETEIENSSGKEKERRVFWNQRAKQLSKENIKKADLYQQIHLDWRMHKDSAIKKKAQTLGTSTTVKK